MEDPILNILNIRKVISNIKKSLSSTSKVTREEIETTLLSGQISIFNLRSENSSLHGELERAKESYIEERKELEKKNTQLEGLVYYNKHIIKDIKNIKEMIPEELNKLGFNVNLLNNEENSQNNEISLLKQKLIEELENRKKLIIQKNNLKEGLSLKIIQLNEKKAILKDIPLYMKRINRDIIPSYINKNKDGYRDISNIDKDLLLRLPYCLYHFYEILKNEIVFKLDDKKFNMEIKIIKIKDTIIEEDDDIYLQYNNFLNDGNQKVFFTSTNKIPHIINKEKDRTKMNIDDEIYEEIDLVEEEGELVNENFLNSGIKNSILRNKKILKQYSSLLNDELFNKKPHLHQLKLKLSYVLKEGKIEIFFYYLPLYGIVLVNVDSNLSDEIKEFINPDAIFNNYDYFYNSNDEDIEKNINQILYSFGITEFNKSNQNGNNHILYYNSVQKYLNKNNDILKEFISKISPLKEAIYSTNNELIYKETDFLSLIKQRIDRLLDLYKEVKNMTQNKNRKENEIQVEVNQIDKIDFFHLIENSKDSSFDVLDNDFRVESYENEEDNRIVYIKVPLYRNLHKSTGFYYKFDIKSKVNPLTYSLLIEIGCNYPLLFSCFCLVSSIKNGKKEGKEIKNHIDKELNRILNEKLKGKENLISLFYEEIKNIFNI